MSELRPKYLEAVRDGLGVSGISGDVKAGGGSWLGDESQQPEAEGCLHLDGSIQKSEGIGCRVYRETDQGIPGGAWTAIQFSAAQKNDFSMWAVGSPAQVVIDRPGFYLIAGCCTLETSGATLGFMVGMRATVNGVSVVKVFDALSNYVNMVLNVSCAIWLDEQDVIQLEVFHDEVGGLIALREADHSPTLAVIRLP